MGYLATGRARVGQHARSETRRRWALAHAAAALCCAAGALAVASASAEAAPSPLVWGGGGEVTLPAEVPGLEGTSPDPYARLEVGCPASGPCSAGGHVYNESSGVTEALLASERSGSWVAQNVELPEDAATRGFAYIEAISCVEAGSCLAVGAYETSDGEIEAMAVTESGGSWEQAVPIELPEDEAGSQEAGLAGVSCSAEGDCTAVGWYQQVGGYEAMSVTETNGVWERAKSLAPPSTPYGTPEAWLESISCTSPGYCAATGWYGESSAGSPYEAMAFVEQGGTWHAAEEIALPSNVNYYDDHRPYYAYQSDYYLHLGVSCTSPGSCTAAGYYYDQPYEGHAIHAAEVDGAWSAAESMQLPEDATTGEQTILYSSTCASSTSCVAVGGYRTQSSGTLPLIDDESGGQWQPAQTIALPTNAITSTQETTLELEQAAELESVSCSSAGNCAAVGYYIDEAGDFVPMVASQSDGTWGAAEEIADLPTGAASSTSGAPHEQEAWLDSVACRTSGSCSALGFYRLESGDYEAMSAYAAPRLEVAAASLPAGQVGVHYEASLAAIGGAGSAAWSVASGSLPAGLTLNAATGMISGTPSAAGTAGATVDVSDSGPPAQQASTAISISIAAGTTPLPPPNETTTTHPLIAAGTTPLPPPHETTTTHPSIAAKSSRLIAKHGKVKVELACSGASCKGKLELTETVKSKVKRKGKTKTVKRTILLAAGSYSIAVGKTETIALKLTSKGTKLAKHATSKKPVKTKLTATLQGGKTTARELELG